MENTHKTIAKDFIDELFSDKSIEQNELTHHGILGMKWGRRRFQNKDGTLTAAGKKRYSAEMEKLKREEVVLKNRQRTKAKLDRLTKKRQELDEIRKKLSEGMDDGKNNKPKGIKDMSDAELNAAVNRLRLEQAYASLMPHKPTKGEAFVEKVLKPMGEKTVKTLGDTFIEKANKDFRDKFGLDIDRKEMEALEKAAKKADLEMKIRRNERDKSKDKKSSSSPTLRYRVKGNKKISNMLDN